MSSLVQNQQGLKTSRANLLDSRVKSFRTNYSQTLLRTQTKSTFHTLASSLYCKTNTRPFSSKSRKNPQKYNSLVALKRLDLQTSNIPNYSEVNTKLLLEKRDLEERAWFLKEQIAKQTRARNRLQTAWKTHRNNQEKAVGTYNDHCNKQVRLAESISQITNQNSLLISQMQKLQHQNYSTNSQKSKEQEAIRELQNSINVMRNNLILQEKERKQVKQKLMKSQKVMDMYSIRYKELEDERAILLLGVNKQVMMNKL